MAFWGASGFARVVVSRRMRLCPITRSGLPTCAGGLRGRRLRRAIYRGPSWPPAPGVFAGGAHVPGRRQVPSNQSQACRARGRSRRLRRDRAGRRAVLRRPAGVGARRSGRGGGRLASRPRVVSPGEGVRSTCGEGRGSIVTGMFAGRGLSVSAADVGQAAARCLRHVQPSLRPPVPGVFAGQANVPGGAGTEGSERGEEPSPAPPGPARRLRRAERHAGRSVSARPRRGPARARCRS